MQAQCDGATQTITYTCDTGWLDANNDPRDGCERSVGGLSNITFNNQAAAALAAMFFAIHGDTAAPFPIEPGCGDGFLWAACTEGEPVDPLPSIVADGAQRAGDQPRAVVLPDSANSEFHVTLRFRLKTQQPIPITIPQIGTCNLNIDTTVGTNDDAIVTLISHVVEGGLSGPTVVSDIVLQQLDRDDYSLAGGVFCDFVTPSTIEAALTPLVQNAITPWVTRIATLCGASESPYFQACPAQ